MTPEQFAYWLQGFTELSPDMEQPTAAQWKAIKEHLQTVFVKVTPPVAERFDPPIFRGPDLLWPGLGYQPFGGALSVATC